MKTQTIPPAVLRPAEVCTYLGIGRTKLHHLSETDPTFPRKIRFSARCVGFLKTSLDFWLEEKQRGAI